MDSTFNIYPHANSWNHFLTAACVKIAHVFSSRAISSRDSQVQKRWRLDRRHTFRTLIHVLKTKRNCLSFPPSFRDLPFPSSFPPLLPFSPWFPWPSAVATRVHYTRDAPREGGVKGSYLICFPSGPLPFHRYRPHTFSFGLGARQRGSETIIGMEQRWRRMKKKKKKKERSHLA